MTEVWLNDCKKFSNNNINIKEGLFFPAEGSDQLSGESGSDFSDTDTDSEASTDSDSDTEDAPQSPNKVHLLKMTKWPLRHKK